MLPTACSVGVDLLQRMQSPCEAHIPPCAAADGHFICETSGDLSVARVGSVALHWCALGQPQADSESMEKRLHLEVARLLIGMIFPAAWKQIACGCLRL